MADDLCCRCCYCVVAVAVQSLYHIPAFCREILSYVPPPLPNGATHFPQCVMFVLELQKLFALLLKSNKMYIDPSRAIQASACTHYTLWWNLSLIMVTLWAQEVTCQHMLKCTLKAVLGPRPLAV